MNYCLKLKIKYNNNKKLEILLMNINTKINELYIIEKKL